MEKRMIQELADNVWSTPEFHTAASEVEIGWLQVDLGTKKRDGLHPQSSKLIRAAAILACSENMEHRQSAFRVATCVYELCGTPVLPLDQGLRVVLARLGNFAAFGTREDVNTALSRLPTALAIEEVASGESRAVNINGEDVFLTDFQMKLWGSLHKDGPVALAAPTSAGKSFVLEGYLSTLFASDSSRTVVYIVPTRALIAQVAEDLIQPFRTLGEEAPVVITIPIDREATLPTRAVYVMTQERLQILMTSHPEFSADLIVVDEAHSIGETARGVLLQWVIDDLLERSSGAQILFASPNVKNLDIFGRLFGLANVTLFSSSEPTVAQNFLIANVESATTGKVRVSTVGSGTKEISHIADFTLNNTIANRVERLVHISAALGRGHSNIVYANGAAEAETIALQLAEFFADREQTPGRLALSKLAEETVHEKYALVACAKVGIAFHYSNIPTHLRRAIEAAMSAGHVDFLVCTSTLLQGVNLPAKNIFMFAPTKGKTRPLDSTDFWNLAGRAGRLRREFQGNIFLIDYDSWKKKPLDGPRDAVIVPAIEANVREQNDELVNVIRDVNSGRQIDKANLESTFVRLYSDFHQGRLTATLDRIGVASNTLMATAISESLVVASASISLPTSVIRNTPNISAHKQQRLFHELSTIIARGRVAARDLIPKHPRESGAFESYAAILERCHRIIFCYDTSKNLHRFHALLAIWWTQGLPFPVIVQRQVERNRDTIIRTTIRKTLDLIETDIRFQAVRLFGCYISLLVYALEKAGFDDFVTTIPSVPLYLEIGASDKTMISFISLGLSRVSAMKLNELSLRKDLDEKEALAWLRTRSPDVLGLSPLLQKEVEAIVTR